MTEAQVLEKLHDIHLPASITWWPLAPGWYLLGIIVLLACLLSIYSLRQWSFNRRAKRQALDLLTDYEREAQWNSNSQLIAMKISELIRRVAIAYFGREVAGLKSEAWLQFLQNTSKGIDFAALRPYLLDLPYQPPQQADLTFFLQAAKRWIKQRGKRCSS